MPSRRILAGVLGAGVLAIGGGAATLLAAGLGPSLPPEKQAQVDAANAFQRGGNPADKTTDRGQPLVVQDDPVPPTGMLGGVAAPAPGSIFTTTNAWAGWINPSTYVVIYAGAPSDNPGAGVLLVVQQSGANGRLAPSSQSDGKLVAPPSPGGPLRIVGPDGGQLVIANGLGLQFHFDVTSSTFD